MASKTNQIPDLSEHKRKVFFERLSSQTTKDSLKEYLKAFEVELCVVPWKEGKIMYQLNLMVTVYVFRSRSRLWICLLS